MRPLLPKESTASTGYLLLSALFVVLFTLAFQDPMFLVFGIPLLLVFILGASLDAGKPEKDLEIVGWSGRNMQFAVPLGIAGGLLSIFAGTYLTRNIATSSIYTSSLQIFVPDFAAAGVVATMFTTPSVIPSFLSTGANIISQWFVVAPSEESLSKTLVPYAIYSIVPNWVLAYIIGAIFWLFLHVPKFITQNVDSRMYIVLLVIAFITTALVIFTRTILTAVISHGIFNTGVIIIGQGANQTAFYIIIIILAILTYTWFKAKEVKSA